MLPISDNKTLRYLFPCLSAYGKEFTLALNSLDKEAVAIGDVNYHNFNINNPWLFVKFKVTNANFISFFEFLNSIRNESFYVDDYTVDEDIRKYDTIVIILKIPPIYTEAYQKFLEGRYSEMYSEEDLIRLFPPFAKSLQVLKKSAKAYETLIKEIKQEFKVDEVKLEGEIKEYDIPINLEKEIFNYER